MPPAPTPPPPPPIFCTNSILFSRALVIYDILLYQERKLRLLLYLDSSRAARVLGTMVPCVSVCLVRVCPRVIILLRCSLLARCPCRWCTARTSTPRVWQATRRLACSTVTGATALPWNRASISRGEPPSIYIFLFLQGFPPYSSRLFYQCSSLKECGNLDTVHIVVGFFSHYRTRAEY